MRTAGPFHVPARSGSAGWARRGVSPTSPRTRAATSRGWIAESIRERDGPRIVSREALLGLVDPGVVLLAGQGAAPAFGRVDVAAVDGVGLGAEVFEFELYGEHRALVAEGGDVHRRHHDPLAGPRRGLGQ